MSGNLKSLFKKRQPAFMQNPALQGLEVGECGFITAETFANHSFQISLRVSYLAVTLALVPIFKNALLFCAVYLFWWLILACVGYFRNSRKPLSQNLLELREIAQGRFILAIGGLCVAWSGSYVASGALFLLCATLCALNDAFIYKRVRFAKFRTEAKS